MKQKIKRRLLTIGWVSAGLTAILTVVVFYSAFEKQVRADLRRDTALICALYEETGEAAFSEAVKENFRVTLISSDGTVLFESDLDAGEMENHLSRPEIREALANGEGEDNRISESISVSTYYCARRLGDGNVLRLACSAKTVLGFFLGAMIPVALMGVFVFLLAALVASILTQKLVAPIEALAKDGNVGEKKAPYPELVPFVEALRFQQEEKEESARIRQEFTANVTHELKTPLTSISGYAEMIENGMAEGETGRTFAGKIRKETRRLLTLIGDIIQLSELDSGTSKGTFVSVSLLETARAVVERLTFFADQKEVSLSASGEEGVILGDREMISELIANLVDNGIRYNRPGGRVDVNVLSKNGKVVLKVSDTGIGIPKAHFDRIFERFYRVDKSRSKESGGTGLGLAIVKHIALSHNGEISLESEEGKGTTITISFPAYSR